MAKKLSFSNLIVGDASDRSVKPAINNRKALLESVKSSEGHSYGRIVLVQLLAEAVVVHKMWHHVVNEYLLGGKPKPKPDAAGSYLSTQRANLMNGYKNSFEPYFQNEPGFMDMDLANLRHAAALASRGDSNAEQQIDFFFSYYSTVIGMCYSYNRLILSGIDLDTARDRVAVTPQSVRTQLAAITSYTEYFTSALMQPEYQGIGRFTRLYMA